MARHARRPQPRRSGVVVPQPLRWHQRLVALLVYVFIRTVAATLRFEFNYPAALLAQPPRPVIFCVWHNRLALCLLIYRDYMRRLGQPARMAAMVSASRDGAMLARILERFGVQPVRGSSSRRGPQALLELTTWGERGYDLAITPDGPRGPCGRVQEGAVALAQVTGLPLVAASYALGWKLRLKSWDRFLVPLPFSRVRVAAAEPLVVPRNATDAEREALRQRLESLLNGLATE